MRRQYTTSLRHDAPAWYLLLLAKKSVKPTNLVIRASKMLIWRWFAPAQHRLMIFVPLFQSVGECFSSKAVIVFLSVRWISPLTPPPPPPSPPPPILPTTQREREREIYVCRVSGWLGRATMLCTCNCHC